MQRSTTPSPSVRFLSSLVAVGISSSRQQHQTRVDHPWSPHCCGTCCWAREREGGRAACTDGTWSECVRKEASTDSLSVCLSVCLFFLTITVESGPLSRVW